MDQITTLLTIILTTIILISIFAIYNHMARMEERITRLEQASKHRLPYKAFEEILNGMAALDVRDREVEFEKSLLDNARTHFTNALQVGTKRETE
jgi:hypothetical protein